MNGTGAFDFSNPNGFVASGLAGSGQLGASGAGVRMVWYPRKAAFRAGQADATSWNDAGIGDGSFAGGANNIASGDYATVFGISSSAAGYGAFAAGNQAVASGNYSVATSLATASADYSLAIGSGSHASEWSSAAIGPLATASGVSAIALGDQATASGNSAVAIGGHAAASSDNSVALGFGSTASGNSSLALGVLVTASGLNATAMGVYSSTNLQSGSFVYGDRSTVDTTSAVVQATAPNQFVVRAAGGFRFRTSADLTTGCDLPSGSGTFSCTSSRTAKHRVLAVRGDDLLARLGSVPVNTWSYIAEPGDVRHIGPFAEDFRSAFGLGTSETSIGLQDIDGVNFAAIKALLERVESLQREVQELRRLVAEARRD